MIKRFAVKMSEGFLYLGILSIVLMLIVNLLDVIGAKFFMKPLLGAMEYTSFFQVVAISSAIAYTLLQKRHIRIEFIVEKLRENIKKPIISFILCLEMVFFLVLVWRGYQYGVSLLKSGEIGATSELPLYPFAFVLAFSGVPVLLLLFDRLLENLKK